ncbi:AFG1 family ATPase [Elioraea sp. Yellowstone]|uniref:cell division protein ZapE n=1 Tax=Elioraea sp. Yellowstone TaxID=2592070 RepID=UPI001153FD3F|nr:cell division protein ZapE [Elioraea sp. Yellowstone]TQF77426.1 AFG1 family ATPase [Elioraea sp. Yellowstone]
MDAIAASTADGPLPALRARVRAGLLEHDPAQALAAERLQELWRALRGYDPQPAQNGGFLAALRARLGFARERSPREDATEAPQGLYIVGAVGRGKSMLMDLFFASAPLARKRRVHFHRFMQEAHRHIHAFRQDAERDADPIPPLADRIAAEAALLCFDEFQVHDIVDAMILGRLFEALFARGVVVVATSNTLPDDLYRDGLQRDRFLPFIDLIKRRLDVLVLEAARDYRRDRLAAVGVWHVPADARAEAALDAAFREFAGEDGRPLDLAVLGRRVRLPLAANGVARADFATLCGAALGPADYLALATHIHTLLIDGIPRLSPANFDQARRFITLVDALYEHRVKLIASAADLPDRLYQRGENAAMFQRTASRLIEMQSQTYLGLPHLT